MPRAARYWRFVAAVLAVAAVAAYDGYLYFYGGVPATISRHLLWTSCLHPALPFAAGLLLTGWAARARLARRWPVLALLAGILAGHLFWPQVVIFRPPHPGPAAESRR